MAMVISLMVVSAQETDECEIESSRVSEGTEVEYFDYEEMLMDADIESILEEDGLLAACPLEAVEEEDSLTSEVSEDEGIIDNCVDNEMLNDITWILGEGSSEGHGFVNGGENAMFTNSSGTAISVTQVDANGNTTDSRFVAVGRTLGLTNRRGVQVVVYYKYTASTHSLLITNQPTSI